MRFRIRAIIGIIAIATGAGIAIPAIPAYASTYPSVCDNGGSGLCLNDWNNAGGAVKMYNGGTVNDTYIRENETLACNNGVATSTCPIKIWGINPAGAAIFEILDTRNGQCVATNPNDGGAYEGTCADLSGNGGSPGVTDLEFQGSACSQNYQMYILNRYWTATDQTWVWLESGGSVGNQAVFARFPDNQSSTCWGFAYR